MAQVLSGTAEHQGGDKALCTTLQSVEPRLDLTGLDSDRTWRCSGQHLNDKVEHTIHELTIHEEHTIHELTLDSVL